MTGGSSGHGRRLTDRGVREAHATGRALAEQAPGFVGADT